MKDLLMRSGMFDKDYYAHTYGVPPEFSVEHFLKPENRLNNPSPAFSSAAYVSDYEDVTEVGMHPLIHYLRHGVDEGRLYKGVKPNPAHWLIDIETLFNFNFYRYKYMEYNDLCKINPLDHYINFGYKKYLPTIPQIRREDIVLLMKSRLFDQEYYSNKYNIPVEFAVIHYLNGDNFSNQSGPYFSSSLYLQDYQDVKSNNINPLVHYLRYGKKEGRFYRTNDKINKPDINFVKKYFDSKFYSAEYMNGDDDGESAVDHFFSRGHLVNNRINCGICRDDIVDIAGSNLFDRAFYSAKYQIGQELAVYHYLTPENRHNAACNAFSSKKYLVDYPDVDSTGYNPLLHYIRFGHKENRIYKSINDIELYDYYFLHTLFSENWYIREYMQGVDLGQINPVEHYEKDGWKQDNLPNPDFDLDKFKSLYPDAGCSPLLYCLKNRVADFFTTRQIAKAKFGYSEGAYRNHIHRLIQRKNLAKHDYRSAENLLLFLVTDVDCISGGLMSIAGIYEKSCQMKDLHGCEVAASVFPGKAPISQFSFFTNNMPIYSFSDIINAFRNVKKLIVMIPEIYIRELYDHFEKQPYNWFSGIEHIHLNILNQNIELMPYDFEIDRIKHYFDKVTQTTAHKKYTTARMRSKYGIPVHQIIPPISKNIIKRPYVQKSNLIVYSPDEHPMKEDIIATLKRELPGYAFREIKEMTFAGYLDIISWAKYAISFGEGLDGYFTEIYQAGGIGFTFWNDEFFTEEYRGIPSILPSFADGSKLLPDLMKKYEDVNEAVSLNKHVLSVWGKEYADDDKVDASLRNFFMGNYDLP